MLVSETYVMDSHVFVFITDSSRLTARAVYLGNVWHDCLKSQLLLHVSSVPHQGV